MDRTDAYLERKARRVWPWAACWEDGAGRFWLQRVPTGARELLSENVGTEAHPRRSFLKARVRLAVLMRGYRVSR